MPDIRTTQQPRVAVTTDPSAPIDATQLARVAVTTASVPAAVSQMVRVVVTHNFTSGSNDKCRIYVVT